MKHFTRQGLKLAVGKEGMVTNSALLRCSIQPQIKAFPAEVSPNSAELEAGVR